MDRTNQPSKNSNKESGHQGFPVQFLLYAAFPFLLAVEKMEIDLTEAFKTCYTFHIDCSFDKMNLIWDVVTGLFEVNHI